MKVSKFTSSVFSCTCTCVCFINQQSLACHREGIVLLAWHPTAKDVLASASLDAVIVWNTFSKEPMLQLECHPDSLFSMSWSYDGSLIATTCRDKKLRVIDPRKKEVISVSTVCVVLLHTCTCIHKYN